MRNKGEMVMTSIVLAHLHSPKKLPPTCTVLCATEANQSYKRGNANIKNHQNLNKAIALGHRGRKCCNKRSNALIVSAMVVATTAGLVGSDDRSHALRSRSWRVKTVGRELAGRA
jgi:hypothetical protein